MAKNPFLVCFERPLSDLDKKKLETSCIDFFEIFPNVFLASINGSMSSFRHSIDVLFRDVPHYTCQVQKGELFRFLPSAEP